LARVATATASRIEPDQLAVRLHHRLVSVHPFPNGNGRWSRLAADREAARLQAAL
jgi:Fic family protein